MKQLLQEWESYEKDRCTVYSSANGDAVTVGFGPGTVTQTRNLANEPEALIEKAVDRAILSKGWGYETRHKTVAHEAWIDTGPDDPRAEGVSYESRCEALLKAYLEALRSR